MQGSDINALESMESASNYNKHIFNKICAQIDTKNVVDFGAGFGYFCDYLISNGKKVIAVEINEEAVKRLKAKKYKVYRSLNDVSIKNKTIVSLNVLEHIEDDKKAIKKFYNFMNSGEKIILYLPVSMIVWSKLDVLVNHYRRYSKKDIVQKLKSAGFRVTSVEYVDFIGWLVLLVMRILKVKIGFDETRIKFYDKYVFRYFIFLDKVFSSTIGKNILIHAYKE